MKKFNIKAILAVVLIMCMSVSVGTSMAYFTDYCKISADTPLSLGGESTLTETVTESGKTAVITNTGETTVFVNIRVSYPQMLPGVSVSVTGGDGWTQSGEEYRYTKALAPNESTTDFVIRITSDGTSDFDVTITENYIQAVFTDGEADFNLSWQLAGVNFGTEEA